MKRILLLLLLLLPVLAGAQVTTNRVTYQTGAPTGTCTEKIVVDRVTGRTYTCVSGTWTVAPAGTVTSVTGTANQVTVTGTTTPVLSIPSDFRAPGNIRAVGSFIVPYATLTDAATVTWNLNSGQNATVTLSGNRTLSITNAVTGSSGTLIVVQDGTGSRTLTLPVGSKVIGGGAGAITLSTAAGSIDILSFTYDGTSYYFTYGKNFN